MHMQAAINGLREFKEKRKNMRFGRKNGVENREILKGKEWKIFIKAHYTNM